MKMPIENIKKIINTFNNEYKNNLYNYETQEMFVVNFNKYNWNNSPNLDVSLRNYIPQIKCNEFHDMVANNFNERKTLEKYGGEQIPLRKGMDTVPKPFVYDTNTKTKADSITKAVSNANAYTSYSSDVFTKEEMEELERMEEELDMQF